MKCRIIKRNTGCEGDIVKCMDTHTDSHAKWVKPVKHKKVYTAQKVKSSMKYFFSKCDQICSLIFWLLHAAVAKTKIHPQCQDLQEVQDPVKCLRWNVLRNNLMYFKPFTIFAKRFILNV